MPAQIYSAFPWELPCLALLQSQAISYSLTIDLSNYLYHGSNGWYSYPVALNLSLHVPKASWASRLSKCWFALNCEWREPVTSSRRKLRNKEHQSKSSRYSTNMGWGFWSIARTLWALVLDSMQNIKQRIPAVKQPVMPSVLVNYTVQQYKSHEYLHSLWVTRLIKSPHCVWAQALAHMNMLRCTQALQQTVLNGINVATQMHICICIFVCICITASLLMKLHHLAAVTGPTPLLFIKVYIWRCSASANSRERKWVHFNFI